MTYENAAQPGGTAHTFNLNPWEAEVDGSVISLPAWSIQLSSKTEQPWYRKNLSKKREEKEEGEDRRRGRRKEKGKKEKGGKKLRRERRERQTDREVIFPS